MIIRALLKCDFHNIVELWGSAPSLINVSFPYHNESTRIFI